MAGPYTRAEWNQVIQNVNNLVTNPPDGCTALSPLTPVDAKHIWSWPNDVQAVQNLLMQVCNQNQFTSHNKWEQSILDEITAAINRGWCGCGQSQASWLIIGTYEPAVYSNCGTPPGFIDLVALCVGRELDTLPGYVATTATALWSYGPSGGELTSAGCLYHFDVTYESYQQAPGPGSAPNSPTLTLYKSFVGNPTIPCGLSPPRTSGYTPPNGIAVQCGGSCDDQLCQELLQEAEQNLDQFQTIMLMISYQMVLQQEAGLPAP